MNTQTNDEAMLRRYAEVITEMPIEQLLEEYAMNRAAFSKDWSNENAGKAVALVVTEVKGRVTA